MSQKPHYQNIQPTGEATGLLRPRDGRGEPITVIGTAAIRETFDALCLDQALNTQAAPGVAHTVLNPDAHCGYGAPIGCVLASPTHIYPGPVGVDIKCSMSYLQLDLPESELRDKRTRRALIEAITERTPTGPGKGQRSVPKSRHVSLAIGKTIAAHGATPENCQALGIPPHWANRCEDAAHTGHDGRSATLETRLEQLIASGQFPKVEEKLQQLGSYGGGNHFGECEITRVVDSPLARRTAEVFGLKDGRAGFLSHCGSRGFGFHLANLEFRALEAHFKAHGEPLPAGDRQLVYAELGSPQADDYLDDMALGGNFATLNHLLINALILEAFAQVFPGITGELVYFISHNIARPEQLADGVHWVHRKGATRAYPGKHPTLAGTPFADSGHPILLPGNPQAGSAVLVANAGAEKSCYSVNHGAGRCKGRRAAQRELNQGEVDASFDKADILTNCRHYPLDEAPEAYKDFNEVLRSVTLAELASEVARLQARFVIKDADKMYGGAA